MPVIIDEFELLAEPPAPAVPAPAPDAGGEPEPDWHALQALRDREAWREERLHAD